MSSALVDLFLDAVRVDALSLHERPMAEFIRSFLRGLPVRVIEDDTAGRINGTCGNIICIPDTYDPTKPAVALVAHMDTPRPTTGVRPRVADARITSDGTTALGVDNRAGTSVLLHTLRDVLTAGNRGNFIVVFTVAEEIGLFGSKHVDLASYNVRMAFVFDCSKRPGTFIRAAVGCTLFRATFVGRSAHSAVAPEKGISAIQIAARALDSIPLGRLSATMTSNVGMISGGTATNVVPDRCTVQGEVREFDDMLIKGHMEFLRKTFSETAGRFGGSVEFEVIDDFEPFRLQPESAVFTATVELLRSVGLTPDPIDYLGGSDANMLNAKGIPAVNLGIGAQNPHANEEFILLEDLEVSAAIAARIIQWSTTLA
jgi:tripeptide aminopeptidase